MKESYQFKVSMIFVTNDDLAETERTLKCLTSQTLYVQYIVINISDSIHIAEACDRFAARHKMNASYLYAPGKSYIQAYNMGFQDARGKWITCVNSGDTFSRDYCEAVYKFLLKDRCKKLKLATAAKQCFDGADLVRDPFSGTNTYTNSILSVTEELETLPLFMNGTFLEQSLLEKFRFNEALPYDAEKDFFFRILLENRKFAYVVRQKYHYTLPRDYHFRLFPGMYDRIWYYDCITDYLIPFLEEVRKKYQHIPAFIQYCVLHYIFCRFEANMDNRNKHVLTEQESCEYIGVVKNILFYVEDRYIFNIHNVNYYTRKPEDMRLLLQIKHNNFEAAANYIMNKRELSAAYGDVIAFSFNTLRINIEFMEYANGRLEIDGSYPDFYDSENIKVYIGINGKNYDLQYNGRYSLTKYFGLSAYKRKTFHVSIPLAQDIEEQTIQFKMQHGLEVFKIPPEYKSHTSRLSGIPSHSYWHFDRFIAIHNKSAIIIKRYSTKYAVYKELMLLKELLLKRDIRYFKAFLLRLGYWLYHPFYNKKNIWMFYDKIYKGGDSSEYLYKYACGQKDKSIHKYYLLDRKCPDYKRLKKEGYTPLKRGSIKHRMIFLYANMMIISNSTVFAFNDYAMSASAFIRGLVHFHVVCVQHGMSVQKIAIAQQRLRDNIRLYFCASKYEIENLSRPVYDYMGYDALKLTGVPRYDGLVNRDKKQILISPTWRMQSAVLVTKNEGVERDYNPYFKDSAYFKVYNSLINDPRLIAAARRYGYRIAYVLHPIVSPQAKDFDQNEYVDIIPATGDMSYETLFCESSLMVTDFSGVQFDFAYMRKPLLYLHHDEIPQHYEEGTFHYATMGFGEICHNNEELISHLEAYMKQDCNMKEEYKRRADDFFAFHDHNNCQRIYQEMLRFQKIHPPVK